MRLAFIMLIILPLTSSALRAASVDPVTPHPSAAARAAVLAVADKYLKLCEPRLQGQDLETLNKIKLGLLNSKDNPGKLHEEIEDFVSQASVALAAMKSLDALMVTADYLVKYEPENPRTTNLLANVLSAYDKAPEAVTMLEYTNFLNPESLTVRISLANAYLNADQDAKAKALLDLLVLRFPNEDDIHLALATYWFKQHNLAKVFDELAKAAQGGGIVYRKAEEEKEKTAPDEVLPTDGFDEMQAKCDRLRESVPLTTADIIEEAFPVPAEQFRRKYDSLTHDEQMLMPVLPEAKVATLREYTESEPIISAWTDAFVTKTKPLYAKSQGVALGATEEETAANAEAAANKQTEDAIATAERQLAMLKNLPGVSAADRAEAEKALKELKAELPAPGAKAKAGSSAAGAIASFDSGGLFAEANYKTYTLISTSYELYLRSYFKDCDTRIAAIRRVYRDLTTSEALIHDNIWKRLQREHTEKKHGMIDSPCRSEMIRHKKRMNEIGENCYKQWVNLYLPRYAQKMRPTLDKFWYVTALYIKNMNDPKVMEREYNRILRIYLTYSLKAVGGVASGGFPWGGPTDEEEAQLQADIRNAKEAAKAKQPEYEKSSFFGDWDWMKWIEDHLTAEASCQYVAFKLTARSIEFEGWAWGPTGRIKLDVVDGTLQTYTGACAKWDTGLKILGLGGKLQVRADLQGTTSTYNLETGQFSESHEHPGSMQAKYSVGPVSGGVKADMAVADSEVKVKGSYKFSYKAADLK